MILNSPNVFFFFFDLRVFMRAEKSFHTCLEREKLSQNVGVLSKGSGIQRCIIEISLSKPNSCVNYQSSKY